MTLPTLARFKVCTKCGCTKPATAEYFSVVSKQEPRWRYMCKDCQREEQKRWRSTNFAAIRNRDRTYHQANSKAIAEKVKCWRKANPEAARESRRNWAKANPHALRVSRARREALKRSQSGGPYTGDDIKEMYQDQNGLCYYCQSTLTEYHIEHQTPLSRGGVDGLENIVLACPLCNLRKHTKTAEEFTNLLLEGAM